MQKNMKKRTKRQQQKAIAGRFSEKCETDYIDNMTRNTTNSL